MFAGPSAVGSDGGGNGGDGDVGNGDGGGLAAYVGSGPAYVCNILHPMLLHRQMADDASSGDTQFNSVASHQLKPDSWLLLALAGTFSVLVHGGHSSLNAARCRLLLAGCATTLEANCCTSANLRS